MLQAVIRERLFVGSIAGGTSSLQLTIRDNHDKKEVRLFPGKIGNASPLSLGIFQPGCEVTWNELSTWSQRVNQELAGGVIPPECHSDEEAERMMAKKRWPEGLRGIFIGISSMFYAALEAGIAERLVPKADALSALRLRLGKVMQRSLGRSWRSSSSLLQTSQWPFRLLIAHFMRVRGSTSVVRGGTTIGCWLPLGLWGGFCRAR